MLPRTLTPASLSPVSGSAHRGRQPLLCSSTRWLQRDGRYARPRPTSLATSASRPVMPFPNFSIVFRMNPKWVRRNATEALGNIASPEAVPRLARLLSNDNCDYVRHNAALSLAKIGPAAEAASPALKTGAKRRESLCTRQCAPGAGTHRKSLTALPLKFRASSRPLQFPESQEISPSGSVSVFVWCDAEPVTELQLALPVLSVRTIGAMRCPAQYDKCELNLRPRPFIRAV